MNQIILYRISLITTTYISCPIPFLLFYLTNRTANLLSWNSHYFNQSIPAFLVSIQIKFNQSIFYLINLQATAELMQETLNFLNIIDSKIRKNCYSAPKVSSLKGKVHQKRFSKFPYAKAIDFSEAQYEKFPPWLTEKEGFAQFMYRNYQNKLMSIPKICQKQTRASDEKYFVSLFLQQVPIFRGLPSVVLDTILSSLTTCYYKAGDVIHNQQRLPEFMGVIFLGSVQFRINKTLIIKQKNDVILSDSFHKRRHQTVVCKQQTILLKLNNSVYDEIVTRLRKQIQVKERDQISDMLKSTFFTQLHIKDKKSKNFYNQCDLKFYFQGQVVEQAGAEVKNLFIVFRGEIQEENHIYIREHNKWPMPHRKWEVRAVYNSYHKNNKMKQFDFFGDEQIITNSKFKSKYKATSCSILYALSAQKFISILSSQDIKRLKKYRSQHVEFNYGQFQKNIREKMRSESEKRKIIQKAINTTFSHKNSFSPKKMNLVSQFEKSMMRNTFFQKTK